MNEADMKVRTKRFALDIIRLAPQLPITAEGRVVGNQLLRCSTSVGANYRAACRAKSKADFISKLGIVEEEADESCYLAGAHCRRENHSRGAGCRIIERGR